MVRSNRSGVPQFRGEGCGTEQIGTEYRENEIGRSCVEGAVLCILGGGARWMYRKNLQTVKQAGPKVGGGVQGSSIKE